MSGCAFSRGNRQIKCQSCDSSDTELHYTGSCFDNSDARYIRCVSCQAETFLNGDSISATKDVEAIDGGNARDISSQIDVKSEPLGQFDSSRLSFTRAQHCVVDIASCNSPDVDSGEVDNSFYMSYKVAPQPATKRLRASSSSFTIDQPTQAEEGFGRSSSLSDITAASFNSDTIDKHVRQLIGSLRQHPCDLCNRRKWQKVKGLDNIFSCGNTSCNNVIGFDNLLSYYDLLPFLLPFLQNGEYRVNKCLFCSNDDAEMFKIELVNEKIVLRCTATGCNQLQNDEIEVISHSSDDDNSKKDDTREKFSGLPGGKCGDGRSRGRTEIKDLRLLRRGDHIAWHQWLSYWHHGLVQEVAEGWLHVIHYNGPIHENLSAKIKGIIMEEWIEMDRDYLDKNKLYRWDYDSRDCLLPDTVIQRAHLRIGEADYSLFSNNCEHFASWCKTGKKYSTQVEAFKDTVQRHDTSWRIADYFAKAFRRSPRDIKNVVRIGSKTANVALNLTSGGNDIGKAAAQTAVKEVKHVASAFNFVETGIILFLEVGAMIRDIQQAHSKRVAGEITRDEFLRITIKRTSEGIGCVVGAAVVLTLPLPAKYIGCTLATLIGQGAGALVGRKLADFV